MSRELGETLVAGDEHPLTAPVEVLEKCERHLAVVAVQRPRRLIGEQDGRSIHDGPRDRQPLALTAAQGGGEGASVPREPQLLEHLVRLRVSLLSRTTRQERGDGHVLADGEVVEQVEELEDEADVRASEAGGGGFTELVDTNAADDDFAGGRPVETADEVRSATANLRDRGSATE